MFCHESAQMAIMNMFPVQLLFAKSSKRVMVNCSQNYLMLLDAKLQEHVKSDPPLIELNIKYKNVLVSSH